MDSTSTSTHTLSIKQVSGSTTYTYIGLEAHFQSDGSTGATPIRAIDQVVSGGTNGPIAFAR
jgi:hypothetical protein